MTSWVRTRLAKFIAVLAAVAAALLVVAYAVTSQFAAGDRIAKGVSVSGNEVGGLSREQADAMLRSWAAKQARRDVTLTAMDRRWSGPLASLGITVDWREASDRAFSAGRTGGLANRLVCVLTSRGSGKSIIARMRVNHPVLRRTLRKVAKAVNRPHADARIRIVDSRLDIKQDSCGIKLDEERTVGVICHGARSGQNVIPLPIAIDRPEVTARDAAGIDTLLASYTTSFNRGLRGRTHNLTLAARCVDGTVLKPGMEFSTNAAVGPRLEARGFQTAQIYIRGKLEDGIGGGVCQVSSTLFNAVLLAGLTVKERSPHSQTVPYVRPGRDATVAYGLRDFRFVNSNSSPVGIVMTVSGSRLIAHVYGAAADRKQVKVYAGKLVSCADGGCRAVLYRQITQSDGSVTTDTYRSSYAPHTPAVPAAAPIPPAQPARSTLSTRPAQPAVTASE